MEEMIMSNETIHINGKVHNCHFCMLSTIKKYKVKDKELFLCLLCLHKLEELGIELEELE